MMILTSLFVLAATQLPTAPDAARIAEIAAALPEKPAWVEAWPSANPGRAKALLKTPIPDCTDEKYLLFTKTGDRDEYQKVYFGRMGNLRELALMAKKTGEREYLDLVVKYLEAVCAEKAWTMPAHDSDLRVFNGEMVKVDLGAAHRVHDLALVLCLLGDRLPAETVKRVRDEMERRVFAPYRRTAADIADGKTCHGNWWFFGSSNWNAVCHSGVVRAALAVLESREDRAVFVEAAERGMRYFLTGFLSDGYCTEGGGYWDYGYGNFLDLALAVRKASDGKVDLAQLPTAKKPMEYGFGYSLSGSVCPNYADGGRSGASRRHLEVGAELWPEYRPQLDGQRPIRTYFPEAQVYIGRSKSLAFSVKGGTNDEMHNHNDVGSWDLMACGLGVAGDPDDENYTARTFSKDRYVSKVLNSYGHPVPVVAGQLQGTGRQFAAKTVSTSFTDGLDELELDLSGAYPVKPEKLLRKVTFDRANEKVVIRDTVTFAAPAAFESAINTYADVEKGADPRFLVLAMKSKDGKQTVRLQVVVEAVGGDWALAEEVYENPKKRSPHRLAAKFAAPVSEATVTWTFSLLNLSQPQQQKGIIEK